MPPRKKAAPKKPASNESSLPAPVSPSAPRKRMGRPPKIEEPSRADAKYTVGDHIPVLIRGGIPSHVACAMAGIHPVTLKEWMNRGLREAAAMVAEEREDPDVNEETFLNLSLEVMQAEAASQGRMIVQWQGHFGKDWRAIKEFMAKRWPAEWGDVQTVEVTGAGGGPIQVAAAPSFDEMESIIVQAEARQKAEAKRVALDVAETEAS